MYNIGVDIGGTKCALVLGQHGCTDPQRLVLDRLSFPTAVERGWKAVTAELLDTAERLIEKNGVSKAQLQAVGISCGGPLDSKKGVINRPPNLPDWDGVPIASMFTERFGVRAVLQNDANACAVAEWKYGAGRGYRNLIFLTFGTGMGAGLILDGKLYSGSCDLAGEVGHIRVAEDGPEGYGKRGSFEGFCSGGGIARAAKEAGGSTLNARELAQRAKEGDAFARKIYTDCAKKLGLGLSVLIDILNPEAIIIGSIYERSRELFEDTVKRVIKEEALPMSGERCRILPAELGDRIGDIAALSLCLD